ncbi:oxygenase MpaB family protein [uncultured Massilia sp.]|uniref:oxygenase MpaB family protein n=1 Tax=uncultured Massilia sp. TaxID=169973 RepID=UPI0025878C9E|nr:oxygenase MpaB family protein [uncultured Massilia sp.]
MKRDAIHPIPSVMRADPPADDAVARMLAGADGPHAIAERIAAVNRELVRWESNGGLAQWRPEPGLDPRAAQALKDYLAICQALPDWANPEKIARAEQLFMDMSMLSCTLLFCASLPECYVLPDLSAVLHAAGQLEQHTDYRIRSTAAMIFPVMMRGGLTSSEGGGVAQALKVRLIHATIRHLILRGSPPAGDPAALPTLPAMNPAGGGMHHQLYAYGWDSARDGLPCNQEELAYTLLTFNYVFLRGLRQLGLGLAQADEDAYLHAWNVLGHLLGIERSLMAWSMDEAQQQFAAFQERGRRRLVQPDPRPPLAASLMRAMENEIPVRLLKPFPRLLTRFLCGQDAARDLGLTQSVPLLSRMLFANGFALVRAFDTGVRAFVPGFSITRMLTRVAGYRLVTRFLLDQTRPLRLPPALLEQVSETAASWRVDPNAPRWVRRLENRLAGKAGRA